MERLEFGTKVKIKKGYHKLRVGTEGVIVGYSDNWSGCYIVRGLEESEINPKVIEDDVKPSELKEIKNVE